MSSIGSKIIDAINAQKMFAAHHADFRPVEEPLVFVWAGNAAEQLDALIEEHVKARKQFPVVQADVRPARPDGTCFYCCVPLGSEHASGCVIRTQTVTVDVTLRIVRRVPEHWDQNQIEFHMNESSWCASNIMDELKEVDTATRCLCDRFTGKFVRKSTEEDEERYGVCRDK